jgi:hypothetical protein
MRRVSAPGFVNYKKGALDSQPQVIRLTSCLPMVGGFSPGTPASSTTKTGRHDIAEILLKVVLNTIKHIKAWTCCNITDLRHGPHRCIYDIRDIPCNELHINLEISALRL